ALVGASMLALLRASAADARARRAEADLLLDLTREMGNTDDPALALARLCRRLETALGPVRVDLLEEADGWHTLAMGGPASPAPTRDEALLALRAVSEHRVARLGPTSPRLPLIRGR